MNGALPMKFSRVYFTTARVIHPKDVAHNESDWLWVNPSTSHEFATQESAQHIATLANDNGRDSGLDVDNYPYFVVKVTRTSVTEKVE